MSIETLSENSTATFDAVTEQVTAYAGAVRGHLADLDAQTIDELTGGLEADLTESLGERYDDGAADPEQVFGPPNRYASDLRAAAGLPLATEVLPQGWRRRGLSVGRTEPTGTKTNGQVSSTAQPNRAARRAQRRVARAQQRFVRAQRRGQNPALARYWAKWRLIWAPVSATPTWARLRSFATELNPLWWALRGWLVGAWLANGLGVFRGVSLVPGTALGLLFTLALTLVSIQWGRGRWQPWRWLPTAAKALSVLAVILALPLFFVTQSRTFTASRLGETDAISAAWEAGYAARQTEQSAGVWVDGMPVRNIFAFDGNGDPIPLVQLFDERGQGIRTVPVSAETDNWFGYRDGDAPSSPPLLWPRADAEGQLAWNAFPLQEVSGMPSADLFYDEYGNALFDDLGQPALRPDVVAEPARWPFLRAASAFGPSARPQLSGGQGSASGSQSAGESPAMSESALLGRVGNQIEHQFGQEYAE